ncbi:UNVERIFIED_CONTAM: hypothetical protein Sangu_2449400 [Sesamum angustifolium]|uniref:Uncharacterized protein n=1 Tax=Sesamum angustifolium TaxID=2727405 RepID=A0AAW2KYB3_9LAMI
MDIKADGHISKRIYDRISQLANRILPTNHSLSGDYYSTMVKDLSLPIENIHMCKNGCILYWKDGVDLEYYKFCGDARYKSSHGRHPHWKKSRYAVLKYLPLTLYLQRRTFAQMVLRRTVRTVGYHYSTIFFLLWYVDFGTYDHTTDRAFIMRTTLMWSVNDLPAYGIAFGWMTTGVMGCLVCIDDTRAFHLQHGRKECYFGCHRQFLPSHHSYRRNKKTFTKNCVQNKVARSRLTGDQILNRVTNISPAVEMGLSLPDGYSSDHKWTKKNIFRDLPY